jgi:hypothetical protein
MSLLETFREAKFVFVDEFGVNVSMRCRYGRSMVGKRAVTSVQSVRSRNISVCAAMNVEGLLLFQTRESAFNTLAFSDFM